MKRERLQNSTKRIFIADNHPIVREGLKMIINHEKDLEVCGEADEDWEAIKSISEIKPDVVIIDIILKNSDGFELTKNLKARYTKLPVIIFSTHDEFSFAERALRAGALAYLMKEVATENIINAIRSVLGGEIYVSDTIAKKLLRKVTTGKSDTILTPMDETVRVYTGNAFDLVGERKRTHYQIDSNDDWLDEAFEIKLRNHKENETVEFRVVEHLYRWINWEIVEKSDDFIKTDSQTVEFRVLVRPGQEKTITYKVHYTW